MSSSMVWIFFPVVMALFLWFIKGRSRLTTFIALGISFLLSILAWLLPTGQQIKVGSVAFNIAESFSLLGRSLVISETEKPFVLFIYSITTLWLVGSFVVKTHPGFIPLGLAFAACLVAARAVEPFFYGSLILVMAVLLSIPMLVPGVGGQQRGILRYLVFQIMGLPFILLVGWMVPGIENGTADLVQPVRAAILLGIGFSFLLAVFPFNSWVPMLAEQIHPYLVGFLFLLLPIAVLVFGKNYLYSYAWLRDLPHVYEGVRLGGLLLVVGGGLLSAFQSNLGRVMGFAGLVSAGFALLAISLNSTTGLQIYNAQFLPWAISLWVWALGLSILLKKTNSLSHDSVGGLIREMPITVIAIFLAHFTLAGLPFLACFPLRQALFSGLGKESFQMAAWAFLGNVGLLAAGLRGLAIVVSQGKIQAWKVGEKPGEVIFLSLGILALLVTGWFPQIFLPLMLKLTGGG